MDKGQIAKKAKELAALSAEEREEAVQNIDAKFKDDILDATATLLAENEKAENEKPRMKKRVRREAVPAFKTVGPRPEARTERSLASAA